jgi:protein AroM
MMRRKIIGAVTIGQAPRVDIMPELMEILGPGIEIKEAGALDGLSKEEIATFAPKAGDYVLVTRLADGSSVKVAEQHITPRITEKIQGFFEQGIEVVALLCTGEFQLARTGLLVRPQPILYNVTQAVADGLKIGVVSPAADQIPQSQKRWRGVGSEQVMVAASPYGDIANLDKASDVLKGESVQLVVLDCMGYTLAMQERVRNITGVPVILARGIFARVLKELIGRGEVGL